MKFTEIFNNVYDELDAGVAVNVVAILAIQLTMKPKHTDLTGGTSFENRLKKKVKKVMWNVDKAERDYAYSVAMVYPEFDMMRTLAEGRYHVSLGDLVLKRARK